MKNSFAFVAGLLLVLGFTSALNMEDHGHTLPDDEIARSLFKLIDTDDNGDLVFSEMKRIFTAMDIDDDGKVTKDEFIVTWLAEGISHINYGNEIFNHIDTNNDGLLDLVDVRRFYTYFDTDGDDKVTDVEFVTTWISLEHS